MHRFVALGQRHRSGSTEFGATDDGSRSGISSPPKRAAPYGKHRYLRVLPQQSARFRRFNAPHPIPFVVGKSAMLLERKLRARGISIAASYQPKY